MRIACLTGGGDAVGLNAAIAALVRMLTNHNIQVFGILGGWQGLILKDPLEIAITKNTVSNIVSAAGTMLHTSRENPLKSAEKMGAIVKNLEHYSGLVAMGGDDTLSVAKALHEMGQKVISVPKTMDLDLSGTDYSVGFWSYVESVAQAVRCFATTCASHSRIGVCEVFGRHSGFTAAAIGIAADADYIIIPEQELNIALMAKTVKAAYERKASALIIVAEGINLDTGSKGQIDPHDNENLKQKRIGEFIANLIEKQVSVEARSFQASHPFRGDPYAYDAIAGYRFGLMAAELVVRNCWGNMVKINGDALSGNVSYTNISDFQPRRLISEQSYLFWLVQRRNEGKF